IFMFIFLLGFVNNRKSLRSELRLFLVVELINTLHTRLSWPYAKIEFSVRFLPGCDLSHPFPQVSPHHLPEQIKPACLLHHCLHSCQEAIQEHPVHDPCLELDLLEPIQNLICAPILLMELGFAYKSALLQMPLGSADGFPCLDWHSSKSCYETRQQDQLSLLE